jgi:hypothetical protein
MPKLITKPKEKGKNIKIVKKKINKKPNIEDIRNNKDVYSSQIIKDSSLKAMFIARMKIMQKDKKYSDIMDNNKRKIKKRHFISLKSDIISTLKKTLVKALDFILNTISDTINVVDGEKIITLKDVEDFINSTTNFLPKFKNKKLYTGKVDRKLDFGDLNIEKPFINCGKWVSEKLKENPIKLKGKELGEERDKLLEEALQKNECVFIPENIFETLIKYWVITQLPIKILIDEDATKMIHLLMEYIFDIYLQKLIISARHRNKNLVYNIDIETLNILDQKLKEVKNLPQTKSRYEEKLIKLKKTNENNQNQDKIIKILKSILRSMDLDEPINSIESSGKIRDDIVEQINQIREMKNMKLLKTSSIIYEILRHNYDPLNKLLERNKKRKQPFDEKKLRKEFIKKIITKYTKVPISIWTNVAIEMGEQKRVPIVIPIENLTDKQIIDQFKELVASQENYQKMAKGLTGEKASNLKSAFDFYIDFEESKTSDNFKDSFEPFLKYKNINYNDNDLNKYYELFMK